jgi:hypothetical protein
MPVTPQARAARLGFFVGFMKAWGEAAPATLQTLAQDVATYTAGEEPGSALIWQTCSLLNLPIPQVAIVQGVAA